MTRQTNLLCARRLLGAPPLSAVRTAELARHMVTLRSARCGGSWTGSWTGPPGSPSAVSATSAIFRVICAATVALIVHAAVVLIIRRSLVRAPPAPLPEVASRTLLLAHILGSHNIGCGADVRPKAAQGRHLRLVVSNTCQNLGPAMSILAQGFADPAFGELVLTRDALRALDASRAAISASTSVRSSS